MFSCGVWPDSPASMEIIIGIIGAQQKAEARKAALQICRAGPWLGAGPLYELKARIRHRLDIHARRRLQPLQDCPRRQGANP